MDKWRVEWWNGWTNRLRVDTFEIESVPTDWRPLIRTKHNMVSVLDIHILKTEKVA